MFEIEATPRYMLGMPPARFLKEFWQKRPLLIRNAFPDFVSPIEPEDLAGLACEELALSRLIRHDRARDGWDVQHGPIPEELFPTLGDRDWTLLVQDVDKWDADIAALLRHFDFLPRWRIDDIMVSFAATGGSVGAHIDQYDVFLLQAKGQRRWMIDASVAMGRGEPPLDFRNDIELKMLREFNPTHDWICNPGDLLYLPPGVPHHGVAENPCLTFSVGMRAPSAAELMGDYIDTLAAEADEAIRYHDPDLTLPRDPNEIDAEAMRRVVQALNAVRFDDPDSLGDWFGRFITRYRSAGVVAAEDEPMPRAAMEQALAEGGAMLMRHPMTRMAWRKRAARGATLYASGHEYVLSAKDASRIAAAPRLDAATYAGLSETARCAVHELCNLGHYRLLEDDGEQA